MNDLHGIILAYHSSSSLGELTQPRNTCSLPYGGRYRLIDFMLSNMVNAGISDIGLIVHENYQSLLDHVGSGKDWDLSRKHGGLRILPPFSTAQSARRQYRGSMDALVGVASYLKNIRQDYVVLAWGDLAVNLPIADVFRQHLASGCDITLVCSNAHHGTPASCNYLATDGAGRITDFVIHPEQAPDLPESLGICLLSKALLLELVAHSATHDISDLTREILMPRLSTLRMETYLYDGYVARFQSVRDYYDRSMDLLDCRVRRELFNQTTPVRTKDRSNPSTYYGPDSKVVNSLIADGCLIEGEVENSILFRGVVVEKGAKVRNCVLMQGTAVGNGACLSYAIADKNVTIGDGHTLSGHSTYPIAIAKDSVI